MLTGNNIFDVLFPIGNLKKIIGLIDARCRESSGIRYDSRCNNSATLLPAHTGQRPAHASRWQVSFGGQNENGYYSHPLIVLAKY